EKLVPQERLLTQLKAEKSELEQQAQQVRESIPLEADRGAERTAKSTELRQINQEIQALQGRINTVQGVCDGLVRGQAPWQAAIDIEKAQSKLDGANEKVEELNVQLKLAQDELATVRELAQKYAKSGDKALTAATRSGDLGLLSHAAREMAQNEGFAAVVTALEKAVDELTKSRDATLVEAKDAQAALSKAITNYRDAGG